MLKLKHGSTNEFLNGSHICATVLALVERGLPAPDYRAVNSAEAAARALIIAIVKSLARLAGWEAPPTFMWIGHFS